MVLLGVREPNGLVDLLVDLVAAFDVVRREQARYAIYELEFFVIPRMGILEGLAGVPPPPESLESLRLRSGKVFNGG